MDQTCYVCQKVMIAGQVNHSRITHDHCKPGSVKWCEWFRMLPLNKRTEAGRLLYKWAIRKVHEGEHGRANQKDD